MAVPVNVAYVIGNTPLRVASVGWDDADLTAEHMAAQRELLQEGLDQGAFGFSTGLTYPPGSFADIDELTLLAEVAARNGAMHVSHVRYGAGATFADPFPRGGRDHPSHRRRFAYLALRVALQKGRASSMSSWASSRRPAQEGLQVSFDAYPYNQGLAGAGRPPRVDSGRGPERPVRASLQSGLASQDARGGRSPAEPLAQSDRLAPQRVRELRLSTVRRCSSRRIAAAMGLDPLEALCDLLIAENLGAVLRRPRLEQHGNRASHPQPPPVCGRKRCAAGGHRTQPTNLWHLPKMLGSLVRDERLMTMEEAIRKMILVPRRSAGHRRPRRRQGWRQGRPGGVRSRQPW